MIGQIKYDNPDGSSAFEQDEDEPNQDSPGEAARWKRMRLEDENGIVPLDGLAKAAAQIKLMQANPQPGAGINSGSWTWIGPGNIGGRIRSFVINPSNVNQMWLGSVAGGIWTTANGGTSWQPVNDFMSNLVVSTIAIDPTNANILYAGTGEGFYSGDALQGAGVFKSTDGGVTWNQLSATATTNWYYVNRLAIHPTNGQIILAATRSGIWRSTDGGSTWANVQNIEALDLNFDPSNGNNVVASSYLPDVRYSTNAGQTWTQATGLPVAPGNRVELAYAPNTPTIVYASLENNQGQIYKSTNGGQTYSLISTGVGFLSGQGWYDNIIWVDPTNPNVLIVGGVDLYRSTNGGTTLTKISQWQSAPSSAHADHHYILEQPGFNGTSNKTVFFANDGGMYKTSDVYTVDLVTGWQEMNNNLGITQFYGGAGNVTSGVVTGGTQDNGTLRYTTGGGTEGWTAMFGGDGGYGAADPTDPNYFYGEYINLQIHRSTNAGVSSSYIYPGITDAGSNASFIAPFILDPNNANTMLAGGASLWRSTNVKAATPSWSAIKAPISGSACPYSHCISAIAVAPGNSDLVWVGHENGNLYKTTDGTAGAPTWNQVGSGTLPLRYLSRITVDPTNVNIVYVTFGGFSATNVWRTSNGGTTWSDVTGSGVSGLPDVPVYSLVINAAHPTWLYVGTEVGIFTSEDSGATWTLPHDGPTNASVNELFWVGSDLFAATHGRGMFKTTPTQATGTIIIRKATSPAGGTGFGFTSNVPGVTSFNLNHGQNQTINGVAVGSYTVTENNPSGYSLTNLVCIDPTTNSTVNVGTRTATINLAAGETVDCTFTNTQTGSGVTIMLSSDSNGSVPGLSYRDEDIIAYNTGTGLWSLVFDGSDVGLGNADIDGFGFLPNGQLLLSVEKDFTLSGFGAVDDADILRFMPGSYGPTTVGSYVLYFDGSDVGLNSDDEDVDAIDFDATGNLIISVNGSFKAQNVTGNDEDLFVLTGFTPGANTTGIWGFYFDGSDVSLTSSGEDIYGLWADHANSKLYLATTDSFSVPGAKGDEEDIFVCRYTSLGNNTACTFSLFWHGEDFGFDDAAIDGLSIGALPTVVSAAESNGSVAVDDTVEFEGDDVNEPNPLDGEEVEDEEALSNQLFLPLITQ